MNIHHKHMQQISKDMQAWTQKHLSQHGIYECTYVRYNQKNASCIVMPMFYDWHFQYLEKDLDLQIYKRLIPGSRYVDQSSAIYKNYYQYISQARAHETNYFKFDYVTKTQEGYEVVMVGSHVPLSPHVAMLLKKSNHQLAYEANRIIKTKPSVVTEFRALEALNRQEFAAGATSVPSEPVFERSHYDGINLTAKEQLYIRHLMFNRTQKEIAHRQGCSETAVRKVITNIKSKLGQPNMPNAMMFELLDQRNVLAVISTTFKCI